MSTKKPQREPKPGKWPPSPPPDKTPPSPPDVPETDEEI